MLWRRVNRGLSAGRVQSPSVRLIVERERERIAFISADYWDIDLVSALTAPVFDAKLVEVDGARVASGKDFDDRGQVSAKATPLDEQRAAATRGRARERRFLGAMGSRRSRTGPHPSRRS